MRACLPLPCAVHVVLTLYRGKIDGIALASTDCYNPYEHFRIAHFVDEPVTNAA
ncbi:hypothetical protein BLA6860_03043 [Burkholderia lata]|nr:hypothetical protein BLA6860_03043 [Burkholderia lata]